MRLDRAADEEPLALPCQPGQRGRRLLDRSGRGTVQHHTQRALFVVLADQDDRPPEGGLDEGRTGDEQLAAEALHAPIIVRDERVHRRFRSPDGRRVCRGRRAGSGARGRGAGRGGHPRLYGRHRHQGRRIASRVRGDRIRLRRHASPRHLPGHPRPAHVRRPLRPGLPRPCDLRRGVCRDAHSLRGPARRKPAPDQDRRSRSDDHRTPRLPDHLSGRGSHERLPGPRRALLECPGLELAGADRLGLGKRSGTGCRPAGGVFRRALRLQPAVPDGLGPGLHRHVLPVQPRPLRERDRGRGTPERGRPSASADPSGTMGPATGLLRYAADRGAGRGDRPPGRRGTRVSLLEERARSPGHRHAGRHRLRHLARRRAAGAAVRTGTHAGGVRPP